jgi:hypothetical protein
VLAALLTVRLIEYMGAHRALLTRETWSRDPALISKVL